MCAIFLQIAYNACMKDLYQQLMMMEVRNIGFMRVVVSAAGGWVMFFVCFKLRLGNDKQESNAKPFPSPNPSFCSTMAKAPLVNDFVLARPHDH